MDPVRDLTIVSEELRLKDIEFVEKDLERLKKLTRRGGQSLEMKKLIEEQATVQKILEHLKSGKDVRNKGWNSKEVSNFHKRLDLDRKTPSDFFRDSSVRKGP